jgi:hypothetical protein
MSDVVDLSENYPEERQKILDGTYSAKIVAGRQRKHILDTVEFKQKREQMQRLNPGSEPAILEVDAEKLIKKYKGTGEIIVTKGSPYPREVINVDFIVGKTWVISKMKYVTTQQFKIIYSSDGVHIIPNNDF